MSPRNKIKNPSNESPQPSRPEQEAQLSQDQNPSSGSLKNTTITDPVTINPAAVEALPKPPAKKKGRPKGSKNTKKLEMTTVEVPRELLLATATLYGQVLLAVGFEPELADPEVQAIATGCDECIKRYGAGFEHWPLVMLITALSTPVIIRMPGYIEKKKQEKASPETKIVNAQKKEEQTNAA